VLGHQGGCLPYVIALVAALSVGDPLLRQPLINEKEEEEGAKKPVLAALLFMTNLTFTALRRREITRRKKGRGGRKREKEEAPCSHQVNSQHMGASN